MKCGRHKSNIDSSLLTGKKDIIQKIKAVIKIRLERRYASFTVYRGEVKLD